MVRVILVVVALGWGGCATTSSRPGAAQDAASGGVNAPKRVKLAVFKVESEQFPELAKALNTQLQDVHIKGVDDYFLSRVTLEVVQLSIECVEQTPACWSAVGKSLSAQKLLMAKLLPGPTVRRGKKKVSPVHVQITLYDSEAGAAAQEAQKDFKNEAEAAGGLAALVQEATGEAVAQPAVPARPTAKATP